jgi:hypothetical protein
MGGGAGKGGGVIAGRGGVIAGRGRFWRGSWVYKATPDVICNLFDRKFHSLLEETLSKGEPLVIFFGAWSWWSNGRTIPSGNRL